MSKFECGKDTNFKIQPGPVEKNTTSFKVSYWELHVLDQRWTNWAAEAGFVTVLSWILKCIFFRHSNLLHLGLKTAAFYFFSTIRTSIHQECLKLIEMLLKGNNTCSWRINRKSHLLFGEISIILFINSNTLFENSVFIHSVICL